MNMRSEITVLAVLFCFASVATLVNSSPAFLNWDNEVHSLHKREAEMSTASAEPEAEAGSTSRMTDSSTGASAEPEAESSSASPEAEPESGNKNATQGEKKKGFFQNIGDNIKNGAASAVEKVKSGAGKVKDTVKKAVNNAATKIKSATDDKSTGKPCTGKGSFSTFPQNLQENCTSTEASMDASTSMPSAEPQSEPSKGRKKRGTYTSTPMPDSPSTDNDNSTNSEDADTDRNTNLNSRISNSVHKKSQVDISSTTKESEDPVLVSVPKDPILKNPTVVKEKTNTTIKDTTVPTLPPLGPYPTLKKPGKCPPLAPGLNCVALSNDAAQCRSDTGCPGTKKCCYFACQPYSKDVGVCESPVFYPQSVSQSNKF